MTDRFSLSGRSLNEIHNAVAINDEGIPCTQRKVCRLLNELYGENNHLKMKNDNLIKISAMTQVRNDKLSKENKELKKQMYRLYNYFMGWYSDEIVGNQFSEMWDMVKEDERWDCE